MYQNKCNPPRNIATRVKKENIILVLTLLFLVTKIYVLNVEELDFVVNKRINRINRDIIRFCSE